MSFVKQFYCFFILGGEKMKISVNKYSLFVLLAAFFWGTAGIFVREAEGVAIKEMQLVFGRTFFTALILGILIIIKDKNLFKIKIKDIYIFAIAGLFSIVLFNYSYYTTMRLSTLSIAAVLLYTAPFFVVIFSRILFSEKFNITKTVSCFVAFCGCCLVSNLFDSANVITKKALFFGLLTGFGYALYTVFGNILLNKGYKTLTITFYVFLFAAVFSVPFINVLETSMYIVRTPKALIVVLLMAIFNTVVPYIFYTKGLTGIDISVAPIIAMLEPVVATFVGAFLYSEIPTFSGIIGIALVLVSVVILNSKTVFIKAYAKINLALSIIGKREDGYHLIDTVMQNVSLFDRISVKPYSKIVVMCNIGGIENENNIVFKAAEAFFNKSGITGGAKIKIKKKIPLSAGLGGGSADAAAVIVALNKIYNTNLSVECLEEIALKIGADVPFFIEGGTKRAEGIGEVLTTLKPLKKGYFVLVKADKKPSTKEMYQRLDNEKHNMPDIDGVVNSIESQDISRLSSLMDNSFISVWSESKAKNLLLKTNPICVSLSGSGPTWFAFFDNKRDAKNAFLSLKDKKVECYFAKHKNFGMRIE